MDSISPTNDLKENNKWGFNDVCFIEEEYSNYFYQFCKITNLHPGLVAFIMNEICGRFLKRETLTFEDVFMYLKSSNFNCHLKGICATPQITDMSEGEKRIADTVLFKKRGHAIQSQKIPYNRRIIKINILVSTKFSDNSNLSILDFPALLLQTTYLQDRFGSVLRSKSPSKTFKDFINAVFAKMNLKVLRKNVGAIYYRSKGYLDFYINDKRNWAIELLRDGDRLKEHQRRFGKHSVYASIKKIAKEWAIIDI
ncbi:hypothetical protein RhiirA4_429963 [Rhizophagus irregularis]|uniref:Uncharacterized protein n=1 Tax=Rhizophagus irregularis TaxID=588596 RepID=A0A2I1HIU3_9GLOM|nr:hypothetical protein RhiirA4_429963 [Rhizophagus irregularis]